MTAPFVVTEIDPQTGALFAQNPWSNEFHGRVAFTGELPEIILHHLNSVRGA